MVKFSFIALASALTTVSTDAASPAKKTIKLGNRQLRRGEAVTEALLKKAVPYKKSGKNVSRRAEEEEEEEEFAIDGSYYLQFSECIDVKTYDEDLVDEDIIAYAQSGQIVAAKSYVLFHVCQADTCYLDAEDDLYMVDLATYLTNVAQYHANIRTDYCEQCEQFADYCNPDEEEEEGAEEEEEENDGGDEDENEDRRRLMKKEHKRTKHTRKAINRKLANDKEYIDCDKCEAYECYVDEDDLDDGAVRQEELDNQVSEWIGGLAECQETGVEWGDLELYVGAMCSPYGDGVELAVFANDACTWYTNQKSFSSVYNPYNDDNENNINYLMYAEDFIKKAFSEVTPCLQKEYANPDEDEDEDNEEEEEGYEVNNYCQQVMENDAVSFANCEANEEEEDDDDDDAAANYAWFTYDVKEADEPEKVCVALNQAEAADYSNYHVYDEESSGSWYMRNRKGVIITGEEKEGLSGGAIALIVVIVLGVIGAAAFFATKAKKDKTMETDYQGGEMS